MEAKLAQLQKSVKQWRKNRPKKNSKLPDSIIIQVQEVFDVASTKEIVEATGLWHGKLREIRNAKMSTIARTAKSFAPGSNVQLSEIVLTPEKDVEPLSVFQKKSSSQLIACIENDHGIRLRIFDEAPNPGELIQNFLNSANGVVR